MELINSMQVLILVLIMLMGSELTYMVKILLRLQMVRLYYPSGMVDMATALLSTMGEV